MLDDGFADVSAGLKYNIFKDSETQTIVSAGFTYEIPAGSPQAIQGNGDGEFNLFLSAGQQIWDGAHWMGATGFRLPANRAWE